jgi:TatD DNase family protein
MLIDTHCHLDAAEFDADRDDIALLALQHNVSKIVIPAVARNNFDAVIALCNQYKHAPTRLAFILCMWMMPL